MERTSLNKSILALAVPSLIASGAYADTVNDPSKSQQSYGTEHMEAVTEIVDTANSNPFNPFGRVKSERKNNSGSDVRSTLSFLNAQGLLKPSTQQVTIVSGESTQVDSDLLIQKVFAANVSCLLPSGTCRADISAISCTALFLGTIVGSCSASPEIDVEEDGATTTSENFGSIEANGIAPSLKTFTLQNEGSGNLTTTGISITNGGSDFSITGGTCIVGGQTIAASDDCTIFVTMQTTTEGALSGNLRITSDDSDEATYNVSLSGTGTDGTAPTFDSANSTPTDNATNVSMSDNIVIDFSENVALSTGNITVRDVTGSSDFEVFNVATESDGATTSPSAGRIGIVNDKVYINPTNSLTGSNQYALRVDSTAVDDSAGNSFAGISDDTTFNFTTVNEAPALDLNSGTSGNDTTASFSEGSGAVSFMTSPTVTDTDTITTITVKLTNGQGDADEGINVSASAQNALAGVSGKSDISNAIEIKVENATATTAEVATFLQAITYNNSSNTPNTTSRTVTVVVNDGTVNSETRTAVISVANVTAASSSAASFNTTSGTNLSPAISFSSDNETLTISSASHIVGSTAQGGGGTDEIVVIDGSDLTQFASLTTFETLSTYNNGSLTLSESQHDTFTTINGTGTNTFTLASADDDSTVTADADIETYVLNAAFNITLSGAAQNITGSSSADTVNIAGLSVTGTLAGGGDTDVLQMSTGANISNATVSAFESLTLSGGASVTMTEAQHDSFSTVTASGTDSITISSATDGLTGNSAVETYVLSAANTFTLGSASQNLTGSGNDDTVNVNALSATGTLAGGSGTDTLVVTNGGNISGATVSGFENLSVAAGGTVTINAAQLSSFTGTVSGSGTETVSVSGDGNVSTVSAIENYTLNDDSTNARSVTVTSVGHSVTATSTSDAITFDLGTLAFTGTITGDNTVADTLSLSSGANISAGSISNVNNLTLASGASVTMTASQHNAFGGTVTAAGSETIVISGDGNLTTFSSVESYTIGDDSTNTRTVTVSNGSTNVSASSSTDVVTFDIGSSAYTGTLTGDSSQVDIVSATNGADVSGGSYFNIGTLSLSSGATVAIDAANIGNFSTSITGGAGSETLKVMDGGTFDFSGTSVSSVEGIALGTNSNFTLTLTDNFASDGGTVDITNSSGSAITAAITLNASAFNGDVLTISATDLNGADTYTGGSGADTIRPGGGTDSMTGNGGNDNFIGSTSDLSGDTITDLAIGDMITLTGVTGLSTNNVRFNGSSTLQVDTDATDFNISELSLALSNAPASSLSFTVADSGANTLITFIASNDVPVFSSLNGGATYTENGSAVTIDSDVTVADTELDALNGNTGDYNNASLTIARNGGANSADVFANTGLLGTLTQGNSFTHNSVSVGTVTTNSAGTIKLTFNTNATSALVDSIIASITYANTSEDPSSSVTLDYTFNDGTSDSSGTNQAVVTITAVDDAPTDIALTSSSMAQSNTSVGADVGTLSTTDVDDNSHTYTLVDAGTSTSGTCTANSGNSSFQINGSLLETQAAMSAGSYIVCVQSHDGTSSFQESFTITVSDDVAPNAPSSLDLNAASDSGSSNTDNYTNDTTLTLTGTAEAGATVKLYSSVSGGTVIGTGTATGGTWEITTGSLTSDTTHTITATATDASNNTSSASTGLNVTLDTTNPSVSSTPDLNSASDTGSSNTDNITSDTTPTIDGTATAGDTITFTSDKDGVLGSIVVPAGGSWSFTPTSAMSANTHSITVVATDQAGNNSSASSALAITIDTSASTPSITTPIEGDGIVNAAEDNDVLVQGSGAESGATVTVNIDGVSKSTTADSSGNWTLLGNELDISALNNGSLTVSATQTDTAGNTSSAASTSITLDNQAPSTVTITTPIEGDGIVNASEDNDVLVQGSGAESGASVSINIGGVSKTTTADSSGNWTLSGNELDISALNNGSLTVSATQADAAGNTSTATTTAITLDNAAPGALTITTPIEGDGVVNASEDNDVLVQGSGAESGATVTVDIGGVSQNTTADSSGNWTLSGSELDISSLNNGSLTVTATQADSAGNTSSSATQTINLDNVAPTGHTAAIDQSLINASNEAALSFTLTGLESSGSFVYQISDGASTVSSSSATTITGTTAQISNVNVANLNEGTLTLSATISDTAGNAATAVTATTTKRYNAKPVLSGTLITSINEDAAYSFTPTLTDTDSGDSHTYSIENTPSWAAFSTATGALTGTPTDEHVGTTTGVSIKVNDGTEDSDALTFNIEVVNTNDAPVGNDFAFSLNEGELLSQTAANGLLSNATDDDTDSGDTLSAVKVTDPQYGTLTFNSDGSFSYQHGGSENHSDSFTYKVQDTSGAQSDTKTVTMTINAVEDAPLAVADSASTDEDTPITFSVVANDTDAENNMVVASAAIVDSPSKGSVTIANGIVTYTPTANENGADTFTYTVKDSTGLTSSKATVTMTLNAVNDTPIAANFTETVNEDTPTNALTVRANATDVEDTNPSGAITLVTQPTKGAVALNQTNGTMVYTPNANENGTDTYTYTIADSNGLVSNTATVTVNIGAINDRPTAGDDTVTTNEDTATTLAILSNDSDIEDSSFDGTDITLENKGQGVGEYTEATVTVNTDGSLNITPKENQNGQLTFTYTLTDSDNLASSAATVTVNITAVNDAPVAVDNTAQLQEDGQFEVNVLGNDTDVDSTLDASSVKVVAQPSNGQVAINAAGAITYTAVANYFGTDSFTYTVDDQQGLTSNAATVTMTIASVNDAPVISGTPSTQLDEDVLFSFTPTASDADQDNLSFSIIGQPAWATFDATNGTLSGTPGNDDVGNYANIIISVTDGQQTATLPSFALTVSNVNDAPIISGTPSLTVLQDETYSFTPQASDEDSTELTFSISGQPQWASFDSASGSLSGTPSREDIGVYSSVTLSVSDGTLSSSLESFDITVEAVNAAPITSDMQITLNEDASSTVSASVEDSDNDVVTIAVVTQPQNGSLTVQSGLFTYQPTPNFFGTDSFTYSANDGELTSNTSTVSINVTAVNDAPVAQDDVFNLTPTPNNVYLLDVLQNDSDIENQTLTIIGSSASIGQVNIVDNQIQYTSSDNTLGLVIVKYMIEDSQGARSAAAANITFSASNTVDVPSIVPPTDVVVDATGLYTKVALGTAVASDSNGNPLAVSFVGGQPVFAPGEHLAYWQTTDELGQQAVATQSVSVHPLISLQKDSLVAEEKTHTVDVYLNGPAVSYPVRIPYSVGGSADGNDHDLESGEFVIESGVQGQISFNVFGDNLSEGSETIIVSLDSGLNTGAKSTSTVTIIEENVAPSITTRVEQSGEKRLTLTSDQALVTVSADTFDANPADIVTLTWQADVALVNQSSQPSQFVFSPEGLASGIYKLTVSAADNASPSLSTQQDLYLEVIPELVVLGNNDTDGDLIPDEQEGYIDSDGDGIPDFQDAISDCNVMQEQASESQQFLVEGDPGVCLRKGATVSQNSTGGVQLLESELPEDEAAKNIGGLFDFIASGLPQSGDTYSLVIPQRSPVPANGVYRKLRDGQWVDFDTSGNNAILSAQGEPGFCPPPGSSIWQSGLTEGAWCVQLQIVDGGPNDDDGLANRTVIDPGGIAVPITDNARPEAVADEAEVSVGQEVIIDVLANDSDADSDVLSITGATVDFGVVNVIDNKLVYLPPANLIGVAVIQYSIKDGNGGTSNSTATVTLTSNSAPVATADSAQVMGDSSLIIDVLANDFDADGDVLSLVSAQAQTGTVKVNVDNTLTYTPQQGFEGQDTITYQLKDEKGAQSQGVVTIRVQALTAVTVENKSSGSMGGMLLLMISALVIRRRKLALPSFALISTTCLVSVPAAANSWSIQGMVGQSSADHSQPNTTLNVSNVDDSSDSWSAGLYHELLPQFTIGVRYIDLGQGRVTFSGNVASPDTAQADVSRVAPILPEGFALQVGYDAFKYNTFEGKVFLGAFDWKYHVDSTRDGRFHTRYEDQQTDLYYGLGLTYNLSDSVGVDLQYSRYPLSENDIDEVSLGLSYQF
ncbi:tandem-95 repeat protein [Pseudoalteromonas sp. MSK9-3]|nr:Ig-like domain-containing protein [Pseudoalteromonas sp. MSK9-3]